MFRLYDQTRRQLCFTAFVCLCIVPTAVVAGWCVAWRLPGHLAGEQERLGRELGLDVSLEGLKHPRPGVVRYEGVKLADPETRQTVFRCPRIEAAWTTMTDSRGGQHPAIALTAAQVEIESSAWSRLYNIVQRRLECQTGRPEMEVRMTVDEVLLRAAGQSQTLALVKGDIGAMPGGLEARLEFHLPDGKSSDAVRMRVVRNRLVVPPANGLELDTGANEVPCRILSLGLDGLAALGPDCRYSGRFWLYQTPAGWDADMAGRLLGIDLGDLVSRNLPHKLTGTADVAVQRAKFHAGRLEGVEGRLSAGPGLIGRSLLAAAAAHLRMTPAPYTPGDAGVDTSQCAGPGESAPYDRLEMDFWVYPQGVTISGRCPGIEPGTVLAHRGRQILVEPAAQPQSVAALLRALVPAHETQLPATRQADWLARYLPMPDAPPK